MHPREVKYDFHSPLARWMVMFLEEKRSLGCRYESGRAIMARLDRHLCAVGLDAPHLPREVIEPWTAAAPHERPASQASRATIARQFAWFLTRHDILAWYCRNPHVRRTDQYVPFIFSHEQVRALISAADHIRPDGHAPLRHKVMPEVFRLLYSTGVRLSEALMLHVGDVDFDRGAITVFDSKFHRTRLVPLGAKMLRRLKMYAAALGKRKPDAAFFPAPDGGSYATRTVYWLFRELLRKARISHGGRGSGPRVHDLRHTFAVHRLAAWYRQGVDVGAKLPYLAAYMGHKHVTGTARYLRLTPEIFPDVVVLLERYVGNAVPRLVPP